MSRFAANIKTYLDVLDAESQQTDDITRNITRNITDCTHLLAVVSQETAQSDQHVGSIGEMLRVVTFGIFYAQASDAIKQFACSFDSVGGGFKKVASVGFSVDEQCQADAEIALERGYLAMGQNSR